MPDFSELPTPSAATRAAAPGVELFHWNPRRPVVGGRLGFLWPTRRHVNNFGDLLGPVVVTEMLRRRGIDPAAAPSPGRLLSIGSVLHFARAGDTLWGTGANGKMLSVPHTYEHLDVRAVRGPRTRQFLASRGVEVPAVYGDPGLLVGQLWKRDRLAQGRAQRPVTIVPNLHDHRHLPPADDVVDPRGDLWSVLAQIAASDLVVASSLHGVVVAESLGVPARLVASAVEPFFKYDDYYRGTCRDQVTVASSIEEAVALGGERPPEWDPEPLMAAFPYDLWD